VAEIKLVNVIKRYGDVLAVDRTNLTAVDKEFLVLVGPSGCGKTTNLRMIAGLEKVTEGEIYIGNRLVNNVAPMDRDIAMVFQNYALYPHMNVFQNMSFGLELHGFGKSEVQKRVNETAEILDIGDLLKRKPKELSGGQRQRVAMGRAIVRKPQVFLFDEPLSNLDARLRVQMREELSRLHKRLETTIVYVTHDQIEAMTLASRIVVMEKGRIMQIGAPLDVYNHPENKFVAGFIGSPAMNFLDVTVQVENDQLYLQANAFRITVPQRLRARYEPVQGQKAILGIRPEHLFDRQIAGDMPGAAVIKVTAEIIEPIGSEIVLIVLCGPDRITARVDSKTNARSGTDMELMIDTENIHLFDVKTDKSY
jgi:multiple sugar transport system ATP-binding protein